MFQRNGRSGYVLKPMALRQNSGKDLLLKTTTHTFDITIISAQQLPHRRDASGKEAQDKAIVDPYVEVTLYVPDWPARPVSRKRMLHPNRKIAHDHRYLRHQQTQAYRPCPLERGLSELRW
jgi:hypothetical protein